MSEITRDDAGALPTEAIPVRTVVEGDLDATMRVDAALVGNGRRRYRRARVQAALRATRIQTSPVAGQDGVESPAGG